MVPMQLSIMNLPVIYEKNILTFVTYTARRTWDSKGFVLQKNAIFHIIW